MKKLIYSFIAAFSLLTSCTSQTPITLLSPKDFSNAVKTDSLAIILDIRKPDEYTKGHIEGATNIDWLNKEAFKEETEKLDRRYTYYIYCRSGRRSNAAAKQLQANGFKVVDMDGGILRWQELGMPTIK